MSANLNISETSGPIEIKIYLEHHWYNAALGFGQGRIGTLVSTDSSYRLILVEML